MGSPPPSAYAFQLATFHVCLLVLAFVALGYPDFGGISELGSALGLLVFGVLWAATYHGTSWALSDVRVHAIDVAMRRGIGGGARAGSLLVLVGLVPTVALAIITNPLAGLFALGFYGTLGLLIAAVVGGAIGFVFSLIDWAILNLAGLGDDWRPRKDMPDA